jgi:hypothetical protein
MKAFAESPVSKPAVKSSQTLASPSKNMDDEADCLMTESGRIPTLAQYRNSLAID